MEITISGLKKYYQSEGKIIKALDGIDVTIPSNRIFTLLGPSGCGKTTLLRCIVGLETPEEGEISIGGQIVWSSSKSISIPTEKRGLGMVFQTYAIWPHMNVYDNVAYPLQHRKLSAETIREKVAKTLKFVQMEGFEKRPATHLSGGQQQRVALARALVAEPKVILFDEPLSNLDAKLREETRKELKRFLGELGITAVYVTHDRIEALALSDTVAVMHAGRIIEMGSPQQIYFNPRTRFVADFIGMANLIRARVVEQKQHTTVVDTEIGTILCKKREYPVGSEVTLCIRPEFLHFLPNGSSLNDSSSEGQNIIRGVVESLIFTGEVYEVELNAGNYRLLIRVDPEATVKEGAQASFSVAPDRCLLVEASGSNDG